MPSEKPTSARAIAADVLNQFDPKRGYASAILHKLLHKTVEKQRVTDLIFGALRNLAAIDMVIAKFTDCPIERIQTNVLNIIRTGAYELIYSPATPDYSIVNEAVKNAKALTRLGGAGRSRKSDKQVGFVNAALRQIARHITSRQAPLVEAISQRTLPQTPTTGCEFDTDILPDSPKRQRGEPDKKTSPADYLCAAFSLPKWLVTNWLDEYGTDSARQICFASNRRPSIYIRPNVLKTTTQKLAEKLRQENIDCEILEGTMIKLKSPRDVTELPGFAQGEFSVQDITATQAIKLLKPQPGWRILDLCAAPGTKTTQLAEATGNKAEIIATDIDSERLKMVNENISRLGLNSVKIFAYEELFHKSEIESRKSKFTIDPIDCVLLDVPCSNTGVLAKRIEVRYRITPKAIKALAETQAELLKTATSILKPNGKICYSTCSIQKQENQQLVAEFLKKNPDFELESEKLILPSAESPDCDGGYTAIILKKQA
jgi:16S rRNA (cytosine967-C5)-methyltransferase